MIEPIYYDLTTPRRRPRRHRRCRAAHIERLLALKSGEKVEHDHTGRVTSAGDWVAKLRNRYGRNFRHRAVGGTARPNEYIIWIAEEASKV